MLWISFWDKQPILDPSRKSGVHHANSLAFTFGIGSGLDTKFQ